jgi:GTPase SAR1 family protein
VTGIAIFTGKDGMKMPAQFKYECLNTRLVYQYNTLSILDFTDKELEESENPFATVVLVAKKALLKGKDLDERLLEEKLMIARLLKEKGFSERKISKIMVFLNNYVQFEKPEMNRIFGREADKIFGKKNKGSTLSFG